MTQASVPTWRERRSRGSGQIPATPTQTASSVRKQSVRLRSPYSSFSGCVQASGVSSVWRRNELFVVVFFFFFFRNVAKRNKLPNQVFLNACCLFYENRSE